MKLFYSRKKSIYGAKERREVIMKTAFKVGLLIIAAASISGCIFVPSGGYYNTGGYYETPVPYCRPWYGNVPCYYPPGWFGVWVGGTTGGHHGGGHHGGRPSGKPPKAPKTPRPNK